MRRHTVHVLVATVSLALAWESRASAQSYDAVAETVTRCAQANVETEGACRRELLSMGDAAVPMLTRLVSDPDGRVTERLISALVLAELADDAVCSVISAAAMESALDPPSHMAFAVAAGRCGQLEHLRGIVSDTSSDPVFRIKAAVTLGLLGDAQAFDNALRLANEIDEPEYRAFLVLTRGLHRDAATEAALTEMLQSRLFREHAAIALGRLGVRSVAIDLRIALRSDDPLIREAALDALVDLGVPGFEETIREMVDDPSPRVARRAALGAP